MGVSQKILVLFGSTGGSWYIGVYFDAPSFWKPADPLPRPSCRAFSEPFLPYGDFPKLGAPLLGVLISPTILGSTSGYWKAPYKSHIRGVDVQT